MENLDGTGKIIGALIVGAMVGAAIGVLFAPDKGSKTRENIAEGAKDLASEFKKKIKDEMDVLRKKTQDLEDMVESKFDDVKDNLKKETEKAAKSI